jgi:UDP-N-acetylglucosamine transferase subunit ALG13
VILATLGTHPQPMDRLVRELDRLIEVGVIQEEVIIQAAVFGYLPKLARAERIMAFAELAALINRADVVISHAGPATLAAVRAAGLTPIVVPRLVRYHEHVDGHQALYAKRLARQPGYVIVEEMGQLADAIAQARGSRTSTSKADVSRAVAALNEIAQRIASR